MVTDREQAIGSAVIDAIKLRHSDISSIGNHVTQFVSDVTWHEIALILQKLQTGCVIRHSDSEGWVVA